MGWGGVPFFTEEEKRTPKEVRGGLWIVVGREADFFHPNEQTRWGPRFSAALLTMRL